MNSKLNEIIENILEINLKEKEKEEKE